MNKTLLISSIIFGLIHFIYLDISVSSIIGIFSSIINHGFTNIYIKWADRIIMSICACVDLIYFRSYFTLLAILLYFLAKKFTYMRAFCCNLGTFKE